MNLIVFPKPDTQLILPLFFRPRPLAFFICLIMLSSKLLLEPFNDQFDLAMKIDLAEILIILMIHCLGEELANCCLPPDCGLRGERLGWGLVSLSASLLMSQFRGILVKKSDRFLHESQTA